MSTEITGQTEMLLNFDVFVGLPHFVSKWGCKKLRKKLQAHFPGESVAVVAMPDIRGNKCRIKLRHWGGVIEADVRKLAQRAIREELPLPGDVVTQEEK